MESIRKRNELPLEETWDLTSLFSSEEEYQVAFAKLEKEVDAFVDQYKGKIHDAKTGLASLRALMAIEEELDRIMHYAFLSVEVDHSNSELVQRAMACNQKQAALMAKMSFYENELVSLDETILQDMLQVEEFQKPIKDVIRKKKHLLSPEVEKTLKAFAPIFDASYTHYEAIKFSDIHFPDFEVNGKTYSMTYNSFENYYESHPDTNLRRKAAEVFYQELDQHKEATASVYNVQVQKEVIEARLRGYDDVFEMLLDRQEVDKDIYNRQIDTIMENLAPVMRKYLRHLKEIHQLDHLTSADLKMPLDPYYEAKVTIEEAKDYVIKGLSILGEQYQAMLQRAFEDRWIDYGANQGKTTGAFCASVYKDHSYILLSFNEQMDQVTTLAHELGHAGQSYFTNKEQNILNAEPSLYFVEAPSTTNEIIMENYLLKEAKGDPRRERWILSQMIAETYYHNFVTHLLEAAYQREVYKLADQGHNLQADDFTQIYKKVLHTFWGEDVEILEKAGLIWMRQPHYYNGLYSYTYSCGLTLGTQQAKKMMAGGEKEAKQWIEVLKMGGSKNPKELALMVDVDITRSDALMDTIRYIDSLVDQVIKLSKEIEE